MKITKILIRPGEASVVVLYLDDGDRRQQLAFSSSDNTNVETIVSSCQSVLPAAGEHPAKSEVEQEISEIEYRLEQLRKSIGVAA